MGYLSKYLRKDLVRDFDKTFSSIAPLLGEEHRYIRWFTGPGLAFLLKKLPAANINTTICMMMRSAVDQTEEYHEGLAIMLFETIKGAKSTFHSKLPLFLKGLLQCLSEDGLHMPVFKVLVKLFVLLGIHSNQDSMKDILEIILEFNKSLFVEFTSDSSDSSSLRRQIIAYGLHLVRICIAIRRASRISGNCHEICRGIEILLDNGTSNSDLCTQEFSGLIIALIRANQHLPNYLGVHYRYFQPILSKLFAKPPCFQLITLIMQEQDVHINSLIWKFLSKLPDDSRMHEGPNFGSLILFLSDVFQSNSAPVSKKFTITNEQFVNTFMNQLRCRNDELLDWVSELDSFTPDSTQVPRLALMSACFSVLPYINTKYNEEIASIAWNSVVQLIEYLNDISGVTQSSLLKVGTSLSYWIRLILLSACRHLCSCERYLSENSVEILLQLAMNHLLTRFPRCPVILQTVSAVVRKLNSLPNLAKYFTVSELERHSQYLLENLASQDHQVRLHTLEILSKFEQQPLLPHPTNPSDANNGPCLIFEFCLNIEQLPLDAHSFRDKLVHLRRIESLYLLQKRVPEIYVKAFPFFCLGLLKVNFQPMWEETMRLLMLCDEILLKSKETLWSLWWHEVNSSFYLSTIKTGAPEGFSNYTTVVENQKPSSKTRGLSTEAFADSSNDQIDAIISESFRTTHSYEGKICYEMFYKLHTAETRLDRLNYFCLLMKAAAKHSANFTESKANQFLVPMFLEFYHTSNSESESMESDLTDIHENSTGKAYRQTLLSFLELFAELKSPNRCISRENRSTLLSIYFELLTKSDITIQRNALRCIFTFQVESLIPYREQLNNLVEDKSMRDALASFNFESSNGDIPADHRPELSNVIMRILYSKVLKKRNGDATSSRRVAIFAFISSCDQEDVEIFINLLLSKFTDVSNVDKQANFGNSNELNPKKLIGFLNNLEEIIRQIGVKIYPFVDRLMNVLISIISMAHMKTKSDSEYATHNNTGIYRDIRTSGLRRITQIMSLKSRSTAPLQKDFGLFIPSLFDLIIKDRLEKFESENIQSPSALLDLFTVWSKSPDFRRYLIDYDSRVLPKLFKCMTSTNVKPVVAIRVLDIIENLLYEKKEDAKVTQLFLSGSLVELLDALTHLVQNSPSLQNGTHEIEKDEITRRQLHILSKLSSNIQDPSMMVSITNMLVPFLKKPNRLVPESTKCDILEIVKATVPHISEADFECSPGKTSLYYSVIAQLFSTCNNRLLRRSLISVLKSFAERSSLLKRVADLIEKIHSFSTDSLEGVNWETQSQTFFLINEELFKTLTPVEWLPILQCLLFFIYQEDLSVRDNAAFAIKRFILRVLNEENHETKNYLTNQIHHILIPAIRKGIKTGPESVRMEFTSIFGDLVASFQNDDRFTDLKGLLMNNDDEANFFSNIFHVQMHRRAKALRRFNEYVASQTIQISDILHIFIPIFTSMIFEANTKTDHMLINNAVECLGSSARKLPWNHYHRIVRQFFGWLKTRPEIQKILMRCIISILDNFHWDLCHDHGANDLVPLFETENTDPILNVVTSQILPQLYEYLKNSADSSDSNLGIRVPIALAYCRLVILLPQDSRKIELPRLLTTLAHIMKSRNQEVRDTTRETLKKIAKMIGGSFFYFIVKELVGALQNGYQQHILSYTIYSLIEAMIDEFQADDLTLCMDHIVPVLFNEIFGLVSEEKEAEDFVKKMKETRLRKSFDSVELLARVVSFEQLKQIINPLKVMMEQVNSTDFTAKASEVLRRTALGLSENRSTSILDTTIFIFQLVTGVGEFFESRNRQIVDGDTFSHNFTVQSLGKQTEKCDFFSTNVHMLHEFGLTLLFSALKREKYDGKNIEHLQMLDPLIVALKDGLNSNHSQVILLSVKCLCFVSKFQLDSLNRQYQFALEKCLRIIQRSPDTSSNLVQQCLKLVTLILRDHNDISLSEKQVVFLTQIIRPDLERTETVGNSFSLIKSIIGRHVVIPEVYDLMENVAQIMITSQSHQTRELCRQVFLQFLLEYPLGPKRLQKHINFLVKNLSFDYQTGRESVVEFLHQMFSKFPLDVLNEYSELFFVSIVFRIVNEDAKECKEMLASLSKSLIRRLDPSRLGSLCAAAEKWLSEDQIIIKRTGVQAIGLILDSCVDTEQNNCEWFSRNHLEKVLALISSNFVLAQNAEVDEIWQLIYYTSQTLYKSLNLFAYPLLHFLKNEQFFENFLNFPHSWVQQSVVRLLGAALTESSLLTQNEDHSSVVFELSTLRRFIKILSQQLARDNISDAHGLQLIKTVFIIARQFYSEGKVAFETTKNNEDDVCGTNETMTSLEWTIHYLSNQSRISKSIRSRELIYKIFAAIVDFLPADDLSKVCEKILSPVYRTSIDETIHGPASGMLVYNLLFYYHDYSFIFVDNLKILCTELMQMIETKLGTLEYFKIRNQVEQAVAMVRNERRQHRRMQAIQNPEAKAKRKLSRNVMKKNARKRKVDAYMKTKPRLSVKKARVAEE